MGNNLKKRSLLTQKRNNRLFNENKCVEEFSELTTVLMQKRTRPGMSTQKIIDEIGDAKRMIWYLESIYGADKINNRIEEKVKRIESKQKKKC